MTVSCKSAIRTAIFYQINLWLWTQARARATSTRITFLSFPPSLLHSLSLSSFFIKIYAANARYPIKIKCRDRRDTQKTCYPSEREGSSNVAPLSSARKFEARTRVAIFPGYAFAVDRGGAFNDIIKHLGTWPARVAMIVKKMIKAVPRRNDILASS